MKIFGHYSNKIAKVANDTLKYTTDELVCPITHELPIDPVIAKDGRIYERSAIKTWFESKDTSPCTNKKIGKLLVRAPHVKNIIKKIILTGVVNIDEAWVDKWNERWEDKILINDVFKRRYDAALLALDEARRLYFALDATKANREEQDKARNKWSEASIKWRSLLSCRLFLFPDFVSRLPLPSQIAWQDID